MIKLQENEKFQRRHGKTLEIETWIILKVGIKQSTCERLHDGHKARIDNSHIQSKYYWEVEQCQSLQ